MLKAINLNILNKANNLVFAQNISFTIHSNEIWRFRGPNGIGKSSVHESLIGLRTIEQGEILWLPDIINEPNKTISLNNLPPEKRIELGIKYTPQKNFFFQDLSIYKNLSIFADYLINNTKNRQQELEKAIETFNLNEFMHKTPNQVSGGQLRLSELSKLMIGKCNLALIDEPFAALDSYVIEKVSNIFFKLKEDGMSFLINDHNLKPLEQISDFDLALTKNTVKIISLKTGERIP